MLEYTLRIKDAKTHTFAVALTLKKPMIKQRLSLPVWIPGSYLVREFAKHLSHLSATQEGEIVKVTQLDKCTWEVDCKAEGSALTLSWEVYAFDTSVRAAYLDQQRGFINGTSVFLRPHGFEGRAVQLSLQLDDSEIKDWSYACALPTVGGITNKKNLKRKDQRGSGKNSPLVVLKAANYDELVDSPIELGNFWRGQFKAADITHELVVAGATAGFNGKRLLEDTQRICEQIIRFWHGAKGVPPFKRYVFMLNAVDNNYGGLEHCASTALICKREDLPLLGDTAKVKEVRAGYQNLLTLICHEYFHAWHVKRMRPAELTQYDYTQENYTELLWFFEGMTSYYESLLLHRAGLLTTDQFLNLIAQDVAAVERMPGRKVQTLAQASFDAWVKFYRIDENTPNATISYYTKGAMVGLCLDLTLRAESKSRVSLDHVMRKLWQGSQGGPITEGDIKKALQQVGGRSYARELRAWVHGLGELPIEKLLQRAGVKVSRQPATLAQKLGLVVVKTLAGLIVKNVLDGSAAQRAGIAAGDEIIAVHGWRITDLSRWATYVPQGAPAQVLIARDTQLMTVELTDDSTTKGSLRLSMHTAYNES